MIVGFLPEHCASDSNAAEQKSKSALFSLIVLLPRGRGAVSQSGGSSLELETKVAEDYAKITRSVTIMEKASQIHVYLPWPCMGSMSNVRLA